jgi:2-methylisocitrate lyase-like PEP mutase family enzyme
MTSVDDRRRRFRELHAGSELFVMPNPWDVGSARLLEVVGFRALATTSQGFAWAIGKLDQQVTRDELVRHVEELVGVTSVPLNVDSEGCFPQEAGGVGETVRLLAEAGASGCSIEDYDPESGGILDVTVATERVAEAAEAAHSSPEPLVLTARAENHLYGAGDLDDTIGRLVAYRDAGADAVYAPGLTDLAQIEALVRAVSVPVNVLALPAGPPVPELERVGVRRVSTGSLLTSAAYAALVAGAGELLGPGTSRYAENRLAKDLQQRAFGTGSERSAPSGSPQERDPAA